MKQGNIRYVLTAIKKDGLRHMAFDNNKYNTYSTRREAQKHLNNVIKNNSAERVLDLVGKELKVMPTECYPGGDSTRTIFEN